jgi:hypothetical protein
MKEQFTEKTFNKDDAEMIDVINGILENYEAQGFDLSLRQLYYQLVSKNLVPNTEQSYHKIGKLVSNARLAGMIDWDMIKDRGREMLKNPHWDNTRDFIESVAPQYRFSLWRDQDCYVEVMVEKQALEGVLEPVCKGLDVPFTANKGYSSQSTMYEASKRFLAAAEEGKECHVIYLGDHDPSGIDMSRDVEERLDLFVKTSLGRMDEIGPNEVSAVTMHRVALNMAQVRVLNPPENPAKLTDSRSKPYIARFGPSSWELDAIEPRQLAQIVTDAVEGIMDVEKFKKNVKEMEKGRAALLKFAKKFFKEDA